MIRTVLLMVIGYMVGTMHSKNIFRLREKNFELEAELSRVRKGY